MLAMLLSALAMPQGPALQPRLEDLGIAREAEQIVAASVRVARPGPEGLRTPGLLREVQGMAGPLLDPLLERLDVSASGNWDWNEVNRILGVLAAAPAEAASGRERFGDLRRYEEVLERVHRDLNGTLGHGVELYEVVPRVHALLEQLVALTGSDLTKAERAALTDALGRLGQVDRDAVLEHGRRVVAATLALAEDKTLLARLGRESTRRSNRSYVMGDVVLDRETGFGRMVVGGRGVNTYDCTQIDVIIDLGGDDIYEGPAGATDPRRRLGVVLDLEGNDTYRAGNDGLGSATYGIGVLVDVAGDDKYSAENRSGGFGAAGFGAFLDLAGDDVVTLGHHGGGTGLAGFGLLWDRTGNDIRSGTSHGFGLGLPVGIGLLVDGEGDDENRLGAVEVEDAARGTARLSYGMGAGVGLEGILDGGVGLVLDGSGGDTWTCEGFALGAGAYGGLGVFVERDGADTYTGGTACAGAAYHHGYGVFFEAGGDDRFTMTGGMSLGAAASSGQAWCIDVAGADRYRLLGAGLGEATHTALAGFFDLEGVDDYHKEQGAGPPWAARDQGETREPGLGLFLDEGGAVDRYRWSGKAPAADGAERRTDLDVVTLRIDR